ncbi:MAG: DUF3084 domain-containing protein [Armatimonadetes bacterium]|nr:DUF3084 domain-containing protein [Armatimonadota bacterium]
MTSPQILLLFVLMGGLIAYLGDWLGRKMGKKRLRIAGLRPRHTATVFTVLMGMVIPIATTYGLITNSRSVRQWLTEGPELARERDMLETQIEKNSLEVIRLEREAKDQTNQIKQAQFKRKQAAEQRDTAVGERDRARGQAAGAKQDLVAAAVRERKISARVSLLAGREQQLNASVNEQSNQLVVQQRELGSSRAESKRLFNETEGLKKNSIELVQQIQQLEVEAEGQRRRAETARKEANEAELEMQRTYDKMRDLRLTLMELEGEMANVTGGIEAVRASDVLFRRGEELARLQIQGGLDRDSAMAKLLQTTKAADVVARERGVKPDANGNAAVMSDRVRILPGGTSVKISAEAHMNALAEGIGDKHEDLIIIASSFYNYFSGEEKPVPVIVDVFLNQKIFEAGDEIATTVVDGSLAEGEIWDSVIAFLRADVRSKAEAAGIIPVHGRETSLGEVTYDQMTGLVQQIRRRLRPSRVTAIAAKDTKKAEPLLLKFKVANP